jgi:hypothetical protein
VGAESWASRCNVPLRPPCCCLCLERLAAHLGLLLGAFAHYAQLPQERPLQQHRGCLEHSRLSEASAPSNPGVVEVVFLSEELVTFVRIYCIVQYTLFWRVLAVNVNTLATWEAVANALAANS